MNKPNNLNRAEQTRNAVALAELAKVASETSNAATRQEDENSVSSDKRSRRAVCNDRRVPPRDMKRLKREVRYRVTDIDEWGGRVVLVLENPNNAADTGRYKLPATYQNANCHVGDFVKLLSTGFSQSRNLVAQHVSIESADGKPRHVPPAEDLPTSGGKRRRPMNVLDDPVLKKRLLFRDNTNYNISARRGTGNLCNSATGASHILQNSAQQPRRPQVVSLLPSQGLAPPTVLGQLKNANNAAIRLDLGYRDPNVTAQQPQFPSGNLAQHGPGSALSAMMLNTFGFENNYVRAAANKVQQTPSFFTASDAINAAASASGVLDQRRFSGLGFHNNNGNCPINRGEVTNGSA
eukprot:CAMPEP_0171459856 /NCGR_PEP_ID=MMETSP0945-20130129/4964_1 /TAXON_ID=109269 /ORGANISM="Vaucheria litorea, Strain CCMP2940" /LENGTH=350 /DNA_ID=CAMNT_0011985941 /DNA_START=215 /DNA_END=1263 /DNA_ORIENTATION=-